MFPFYNGQPFDSNLQFAFFIFGEFYVVFLILLAFSLFLRMIMIKFKLINSYRTINLFVFFAPLIAFFVFFISQLTAVNILYVVLFAAVVISSLVVYYLNEQSDSQRLRHRK